MKQNIFTITAFFVLLASITAPKVLADSCTPSYGGNQSCPPTQTVLINKTVQNPQTGGFVDNLGVNDPMYAPDQTVNFQISIANTGNVLIPQIFVKDIFPQFVSSIAGPGTIDTNTQIESFEVDNLAVNETRTFTLTAKTALASILPSDKDIVCVVNQATATVAATSQTSQDNSQVCINKQAQPTTVTTTVTTKGGLPVQPLPKKMFKTPATGPEALPLIALIPSGIAGIFLRKKSSLR